MLTVEVQDAYFRGEVDDAIPVSDCSHCCRGDPDCHNLRVAMGR